MSGERIDVELGTQYGTAIDRIGRGVGVVYERGLGSVERVEVHPRTWDALAIREREERTGFVQFEYDTEEDLATILCGLHGRLTRIVAGNPDVLINRFDFHGRAITNALFRVVLKDGRFFELSAGQLP